MQHLKELREKKGLTQVQLAEMIGVGQGAVSAWETHLYEIPRHIDTLVALAGALGCSTDYLLGLDDCRTKSGQFLVDRLGFSVAAADLLAGSGADLVPFVCALVLSDQFREYKQAVEMAVQADFTARTADIGKSREKAARELLACLWSASNASTAITKQIVEANTNDFMALLGL